jgi:hypothetical protein
LGPLDLAARAGQTPVIEDALESPAIRPIIRLRGQTMKSITLYKYDGTTFRSFDDIFSLATENGVLTFRWMKKPGDQGTAARVMTTLPFYVEDDLQS